MDWVTILSTDFLPYVDSSDIDSEDREDPRTITLQVGQWCVPISQASPSPIPLGRCDHAPPGVEHPRQLHPLPHLHPRLRPRLTDRVQGEVRVVPVPLAACNKGVGFCMAPIEG